MTLLFHAAPDLLDEFKQFLPDTSAPPTSDGQSVAASAAAVGARNAQASGSAKRPATQAAQKIETSAAKKPKVSRAKVDDKGKVSSNEPAVAVKASADRSRAHRPNEPQSPTRRTCARRSSKRN